MTFLTGRRPAVERHAIESVRRMRVFLVGRQGIGSWTRGLKVRRSAIELTARGRVAEPVFLASFSFPLRSESEIRTHGLRIMSPDRQQRLAGQLTWADMSGRDAAQAVLGAYLA